MLDQAAFKRIVESSAFHKMLGLQLERFDSETGIAVLKLGYQPDLSIFPEPGAWHGGVIASLVDVAGAVACGLRIGRPPLLRTFASIF